jgi:hemerythrin superfamily protein
MEPLPFMRAAGFDAVSPIAALQAGKKVAPDAIGLLMQDHRTAETLFSAYRAASSDYEKAEIAELLCLALTAHMEAEEAVLYPMAREVLDEDLVDVAEDEHQEAKALVEQIETASGAERDGLMVELEAEVLDHVAKEEADLFPKLRARADLDLYAIGRTLAAARLEVVSELAGKPLPQVDIAPPG